MNLISPISALIAAAITVPLLLSLYFLKLRRRYLRIPSTLLWSRAFEDLEVNSPFQRLRYSPLLLLQMLLLVALLMAMARPVTEGDGGRDRRMILLIDRSASMNADIADGLTRFELAQMAARGMIERLGRGSLDSEVMIIAFGSSPSVVTSFTHDRRTLVDAINTITPTHEQADLDAALQLAAGFAGHGEDPGEQDADVILFSDGVVGKPDDAIGFRLATGRFRFVNVLTEAEGDRNLPSAQLGTNIGITSISARRSIEDPVSVVVFARFINTSTEAAEPIVTLRVDGNPVKSRRLTIPGTPASADRDEPAGEASVSFTIQLTEGGVISVEHSINDSLAADDVAHLILPAPRQPRIAVVHPGGGATRYVVGLLNDFDPHSIDAISAEEFAELDKPLLDAGELYDMVVFDRVSADRLPGIPTITFGGAPSGVQTRPLVDERGRRILSWDRQHALMRHVSLDQVAYRGFNGFELPANATSLARGPDGPVIAVLRRRGTNHILIGFELNRDYTNWLTEFSILIFMQNALDFLMLNHSGATGLAFRPGDTVRVRPRADVSELRISGLDEGVELSVSAEPGVERTIPALRRAGVYRIDGAAEPFGTLALNVMSDQESDIRPRSTILVNAQPTVGAGGGQIVPREIWPWLVALALGLLVVEWLMYCRRVSSA